MEGTTSTNTPSTPTATPTAAPATSAPSASPTPGQRPTFAQAFAQDAAPTAPETASPEAAPTTPSVTDTPVESATPTPSEPPKERWDSILANAREKARSEAEQQFQQQYGWAMQADRAVVEQAIQLGQSYTQDKPAFIRSILAEAITDPNLAPLVRSEAARVLGARNAAPPPQPQVDLSPDIPVMDANGQVVAQTYSHERLQQVVQKAIEDFASRELSPIKQDYQTRQEQEQAARAQQELHATVQDIYSETSDLPGFKEHEQEIAKVFASIPGDPAKALRAAWKQVVGSTLANANQVKANTLKELQTKAAASAVNPASAVIPTTQRPRSFNDPSLKWA